MATNRLILGIICFIAVHRFSVPDRDLLARPRGTLGFNQDLDAGHDSDMACRNKILDIARKEVGVREKTGHNDGKQVEAYLAVTHLPKGYAWCASFISWVFAREGFREPRTAWSPALFPVARLTTVPAPGQLFGIYFPSKKRIAHVGIIEQVKEDWCLTIEGNTNLQGSAEGDGVYRRRRLTKTLYRTADWLQPK